MSATDVDGDVKHFYYDWKGRLNRIVYPNGGAKTYTYTTDGTNRIASESDDGGVNLLSYAYSPSTGTLNGSTTVTDALGRQTQYAWQNFGGAQLTTSITDPASNVSKFTYDVNGQMTGATDALNRSVSMTRDALGNVTSFADPTGGTSQATYEQVFSLPTSFSDPKGNRTTLTRDGFGNPVQMQDSAGDFTLAGYDSQGHVVSVKDALGNATGIAYDGNGAPISVTDPLGRTVNMTRDALSRMTKV